MLNFKINNCRKILLFLCIFSIVYSLLSVKIYRYPILGDERTYYAYGVNLYEGRGYSYQESMPFEQSNLREPGYPFFICWLFKLFGVSKTVIQVSQALLNGIIVAFTYAMAKFIFGDQKKALAAAFLTSISPAIAGYAALIASETLATLLLILSCLAFLMLLKAKKVTKVLGFSALTGLFCACLALTKMVYLPFFLLISAALLILPADKRLKYKSALCIAVIFIIILLPWFLFNKRVYGNPFFLTNRGGITLTIKAERLGWTPKEALVSFVYPVSEWTAQRYFPHEYNKVTYDRLEGSAFKAAYDKYDALISRGYSEMAADKELRSKALSRIEQNFLKYIALSASDFHYMLYFEGLPLAQFTDFFKRQARLAINAFFKVYSLLIIFFAVKGAFIMFGDRKDTAIKAVFLLPVFYTFFMYSAIFGAPRFTFTVIPFIYILASAGIYGLIKARVQI